MVINIKPEITLKRKVLIPCAEECMAARASAYAASLNRKVSATLFLDRKRPRKK